MSLKFLKIFFQYFMCKTKDEKQYFFNSLGMKKDILKNSKTKSVTLSIIRNRFQEQKMNFIKTLKMKIII